jgi:hypothetical protein
MEMIGKKFGKLTVIEYVRTVNVNGILWKCSCECGEHVNVYRRNLTKKQSPTKSCGCLRKESARKRMTGDSHHNWGGGKPIINGKGYMEYRHGELRGVREHRHIYEKYYSIKLGPHQNIHHINGNRLDNRIENLELWDTSQPSGQRIEDKIKYYFKLVEDYRNHPKYKDLILSL